MGLPNPGIKNFEEKIKKLKQSRIPVIGSIFGSKSNEFVELGTKMKNYGANALELNMSCPHAKGYGQAVLPLDVMARANGTLQVMTAVLLPAGALIAGVLETATSVTRAVWVGTVGGLFAVAPLLRPGIYRLVSMPA